MVDVTEIPIEPNIFKIYSERFREADHLYRIQVEAQTIVNDAMAAKP